MIGMLITYFKDSRTLARYRSGLANLYLENFIVWLESQGYRRCTIRRHVREVVHFADWAEAEGLALSDLHRGALNRLYSQHIHIILDNYSTHKHPAIKRWLARHPRFELHFTPTGSSWMNLVERFFRDLSHQAILPVSFGSVRQLVDAIMQYLAQHHLNPKRYDWRANGEEILGKIQRAWKTALGEE